MANHHGDIDIEVLNSRRRLSHRPARHRRSNPRPDVPPRVKAVAEGQAAPPPAPKRSWPSMKRRGWLLLRGTSSAPRRCAGHESSRAPSKRAALSFSAKRKSPLVRRVIIYQRPRPLARRACAGSHRRLQPARRERLCLSGSRGAHMVHGAWEHGLKLVVVDAPPVRLRATFCPDLVRDQGRRACAAAQAPSRRAQVTRQTSVWALLNAASACSWTPYPSRPS